MFVFSVIVYSIAVAIPSYFFVEFAMCSLMGKVTINGRPATFLENVGVFLVCAVYFIFIIAGFKLIQYLAS